ncbi:MAG: winged helix-turn-helix transcriptional regulator [Thaumarchaeota archaeon]|nr:winged helix-turn-helix transcriptional regulator [Nitrososphaerota archaeon]
MTLKSIEWGTPHSLFFKALANPARMSIMSLLHTEPRSVTEIFEELGFEQTMVSHHLRCLSFCGFVKSNRKGKSKIYSLNKETIVPILEIVERHLVKYASSLYSCDVLER